MVGTRSEVPIPAAARASQMASVPLAQPMAWGTAPGGGGGAVRSGRRRGRG